MNINVDLIQQFFNFFDKKTSSGVGPVKSNIVLNQTLSEELYKPYIGNFEKRKVHSSFTDNIGGADHTDMQLISKFSKEFRFLLCVIDIYSKCVWVAPLKYKRGTTITNAFQKNLDG